MEEIMDVPQLIKKLRQERLHVEEERKIIQNLNEKVHEYIKKNIQTAWINSQQRVNLNTLVLSRIDLTLDQCYRRSKYFNLSVFAHAKEVLDYQSVLLYGDFLRLLRNQPEQLAYWLATGERLSYDPQAFYEILHCIVTGLYGCLILPDDINLMLLLLKQLAYLQLVSCDNPRRLLRQGSCSFAKMYFLFHESLHSARLFLISTLQGPILKIISSADIYLDVDPDRAIMRFSAAEVKEKFGIVGTPEYEKKVADYRSRVVSTLVDFANSFILSLHENVFCFPSALGWLIWQIGKMMAKSFGENSKEVNAIATDLIFTSFICPAILNPEYYGISDAPISEIAQHNLMQVARILQMLALYRYETPDQKMMDLYSLFNSGVVLDIVDILLQQYSLGNNPPMQNIPGISKSFLLLTEHELYNLVSFLQMVHSDSSQHSNTTNASSLDHMVALLLSLSESQAHISLNPTVKAIPNSPNGVSKRNLLNRVSKSHLSRLASSNSESEASHPTVLIIPLTQEETYPVGLHSEQKILNMQIEKCQKNLTQKEPVLPNGDLSTGQEKRTRFSNSHDDGSIGNTSDNLEAISEAASNHSVDSSIEMENEDQNDNDNLSDMVSANVSGRGSPNISGRDTPSSQVTENEDVRHVEARQEYMEQPRRTKVQQIRSEIDDKFCKFEIKKLLEGDETVSIISDTWSTDVLASDSETVDAGDRHERNFSPIVEQPLDNMSNPLLDISETQSESAWSMDVLPSDTERLTEVDNDDLASVAPSDDTASVARSDDVAPSDDASREEENANLIIDRRSSAPNSVNSYNYQEYRENSNFLLVSEYNNNMLTNTSYHMQNISEVKLSNGRDVLDSSISKISELQGVLTKRISNLEIAGPSGINKSNSDNSMEGLKSTSLVQKNIRNAKYEDVQLSNSSINSSSSGSSHGSDTQPKPFQHKTGPWKTKVWQNGSETSLNITSTPSESTSELSVMSVNTLISPVNNMSFAERKSATLNSKVMKANASTGAIPKSISFDTTADKNYRDADDDPKSKRGGFFGKLKMFKSRRGKSVRGDEYNVRFGSNGNGHGDEDVSSVRKGGFIDYSKQFSTENSEDILAKYRNKPNNESNNTLTNASVKPKPVELCDRDLKIDYNMNNDFMNTDCKRKLRLVLSHSQEQHNTIFEDKSRDIKKYLEVFLHLELAKAKSLKQWSAVARTAEALRCIRALDSMACHKLFEILRQDYCQRAVYIEYLQNSKQLLLSTEAYLNLLEEELNNDAELCKANFIDICVSIFLEKQESKIGQFCQEFKLLNLADEKNDLLSSFLGELFALLSKDPLWLDTSDSQIDMAQVAIEQSVMTKVYIHALYPNGDGDRHRDSLLHDHLKKLSSIITPNHKDLLINKIYLNEFPWLPAQEALQMMAAYRTPRDKVRCMIRCATAIMDLLSLAQGRGSTAADDFTPVLVYVIIKVNPYDLLSTIQYVNSFYSNQITGEDEYWWTQFCSAVEYTKTMDYSY